MLDLKIGDEVRFKADQDRTGIVFSLPIQQGGVWYVKIKMFGASRPPETALVDSLEKILVPISGRERLLAGEFMSRRHLRARLTYEKLANPLRDVLYSLRAARTDFLPHQFKPVLKYLESPANGLLIADEVGLGKTIEAGYILKELRARQRKDFRRALVVCPAGLRIKWQQELNRRFAESFEIADARKVRDVMRKIEDEGERAGFGLIVSYQTLRTQPMREALKSLGPINLTIVDEAHHFRNPGRQTHLLGKALRDISDNLVFLSATPVHLGDENLHTLLKLLAPDHVGDYASFSSQLKANRKVLAAARMVVSPDPEAMSKTLEILDELVGSQESGIPQNALRVVRDTVATVDLSVRERQLELRSEIRELSPLATLMTRTRKREVSGKGPRREAWQPEVILSDDERAVYDFFTAEARNGYGGGEAARERQTSRFKNVILQQQMASCLPAFLRSRYDGLDGLVGYGNLRDLDDLEEELTEEEMSERAARIRQSEEVTSAIKRLIDTKTDSKFAQFVEVIRRVLHENPRGKVVVFSFFKATLGYLSSRLHSLGIKSELISGDVPSTPENPQKDKRAQCVERFHTDPTVKVLLSSEVGSEGLDFQEASNVVIHYDLPWNPMKIEQRIGRVDRHLQPHPVVYTVSFAIPGTIEERIRIVLHERIGVFQATIGDLEEIISEVMHKMEHIMMSPHLTERQRESQMQVVCDAVHGAALAQRTLEEQGARLMGHDDTFDQELALIERSGRSVAADEVAEFIESALETAGISGVPIIKKGRRATRVDETLRLQDFLRKHLPMRVRGRIQLLSERPGLPVELDYLDPKAIHFVPSDHALAQAALAAREKLLGSADEPVAAIRLEVRANGPHGGLPVRAGKYAFTMARMNDVGSFRDSYSIVGAVVDHEGFALDPRVGEQLIYAALDAGQDDGTLALPADRGDSVIKALELEIVRRSKARSEDLRERHARSIEMRLESQRSSAQSRLRGTIARIEAEGFDSSHNGYRNLVMGQRRNIEAELEKIEASFRNPVQPTVTHELFGYGLIEVVK